MGSAGVSGTAVWGGDVWGDRWEGWRVLRVSLRDTRGCQRQVENLGIEQKIVAFQHCPY